MKSGIRNLELRIWLLLSLTRPPACLFPPFLPLFMRRVFAAMLAKLFKLKLALHTLFILERVVGNIPAHGAF